MVRKRGYLQDKLVVSYSFINQFVDDNSFSRINSIYFKIKNKESIEDNDQNVIKQYMENMIADCSEIRSAVLKNT